MTTGDRGTPAQVVVTVDLRGGAPGPADGGETQDLVERTLREHGLTAADSSRVLIVGDQPDLPQRIGAFDRVRALPGFGPTLYLLFGDPAGDNEAGQPADPWVLRYPVLSSRHGRTGVLWAGTTRGIGFQPGHSGIQTRSGPKMDTAAADELIQILTMPPVFDRVLGQLAELGAPVACLGVRVVRQDVPDPQVRRSLAQAAVRLADGDDTKVRGGQAAAPAGPGAKPSLLETLSEAYEPDRRDLPTWRMESGQLPDLQDRCANQIAEAEQAVAGSGHYRTVLAAGTGPADEALAEAGRALAAYRATLIDAMADIDGAFGIDPDTDGELRALGIRIPAFPDGDGRNIDAALHKEVLDRLDRGVPLGRIAAHLADLAGRITPVGSAARIDKVEQICPATLLEQLSDPPPINGEQPAGGDLALTSVAALLAGLWFPVGLVAGPLMAVALTSAVLTGPLKPPMWRRKSDAKAYGAAGLVGAVAGAGAGFFLHLPAVAGAVALAAGVAAGVWQSRRRWVAAVAAWSAGTGIDKAVRAMHALDRLLDQVVRDWTLANARLHASESARTLAGVLTRVADALCTEAAKAAAAGDPDDPVTMSWEDPDEDPDEGSGDEFEADQGGRWPREAAGRRGGANSAEVSDLLVRDLSDIVAELLDEYIAIIGDDPDGGAALEVESNVRDLVLQLRAHQRRNGIASVPEFLRRARTAPLQPRLAGFDQARILRAISVLDGSPNIRQLCTAEQLCMLNRDTDVSKWVRFAHRSVQEHTRLGERGPARTRSGSASLPESVLWLGTGRFAGSLRLTPLALGAASVVRAQNPDGGSARRRDGAAR